LILYVLGVFLAFSLGFLLAAVMTGGSQGLGAQEAYATQRFGAERPDALAGHPSAAWGAVDQTKVS
jgi:hypothetical protein